MPEEPSRKSLEERNQMTDIERLRHSTAHVLATAVLKIWPDAQFAAGPPVENGFYYDVELEHRVSIDDFPRIEEEMKKVIKENQRFDRRAVSRDEALQLAQSGRLAALGERTAPSKFKLDLLTDIPEDEEISLFTNGQFIDLCAGPHIGYSKQIKAYKLMSVASAYYKGDAANPQLQRIYGTAFPSKEELEAYLNQIEEAKKRDHRRIGKDLELFHIDPSVGQGLVLWLPNGAIVRQALQDFISEELRKGGYQQVFTPHIGNLDLYRTSGHFPYYSESQFSPIVEREALDALADEGCGCGELSNRLAQGAINGFLLKPMNCPMHIKIFDAHPHSYRDLPVRLAEFGTVYRWEQSGELNGLTRVRCLTQDDAHIFCTDDQVAGEIRSCLELVQKVLGTLGMQDYRVRVGLRDPDGSKYVGDTEVWNKAEATLREAAGSLGVPFSEEAGEAAFYGPKIDFVVKDVLGRDWQLGTVQLDYNLPERFDLSYIGADNKAHRPVMIHRAPFGSMERFVGVLIEHFAGAFPLWLAPEQVRVLPISEKHEEYANGVLNALKEAGFRAKADSTSEKIGAKIRLAQIAKVPYMIIVGAKEEAENLVAVRSRKAGDLGATTINELLERLGQEANQRTL